MDVNPVVFTSTELNRNEVISDSVCV